MKTGEEISSSTILPSHVRTCKHSKHKIWPKHHVFHVFSAESCRLPITKRYPQCTAVVRPPSVLRSHDGCVKTHSAEPARHLRRDIRVTWMMGDMNCYGSYGSFQDSMDFKGVVIPCTPQSSPHSYVSYVSYVITASYVISASQHIAAVQSFNPVSIGSARISANSSESSRPSPLMSAALKRMDLENWLEKDAQPVMSPVMDFWIQPWGIK